MKNFLGYEEDDEDIYGNFIEVCDCVEEICRGRVVVCEIELFQKILVGGFHYGSVRFQ